MEGCLGVPCIERQHYHFRRVALPMQAPKGLAATRYSIWRDPLLEVTASSVFLLHPEIIVGVGFIAPMYSSVTGVTGVTGEVWEPCGE